ncbi:MAG: uncharacterized protein QOD29_4995 [Alphaproteobacteria bacterium]|jgi:uncharacterized protein|nr:uncharacterized protein [Alphaproteobacteria bacterium]
MADLSAAEVIELLDLKPHPEGGHFRETFRDRLKISNTRAASSAIYFLLARGQRSCWHKIDAVEIWHYHAGAALELQVALRDTGPTTRLTLGPDLMRGARPQVIVPARAWQSAHSLGDWTLVGCTVAPAFEFAAFEVAPEGWTLPCPQRIRP